MDLPEEQKQEYNRMIEDLAAYAKTLDLDVNQLTQDAAKFANEMASMRDQLSLYPDKPRILREIISFGNAVDKEIKRQINNGLYRIELSDMRVDTKGNIYDRRVRRVNSIVNICEAELFQLTAPDQQW